MHDALHRAIGGFEKMVKTLEMGMESAWRGAREHAPEAVVGTRPSSASPPYAFLSAEKGC